MIDSEDRLQLGQTRLFAGVGMESVEHLFDSCHVFILKRGEHLLESGAAARELYLVLGGELRAYLADNSLPERAVMGAGDCAGELALIEGQSLPALMLAAHETRLLAIPHSVLWSMVDCSHAIARNLLAILAGRLRENKLALVALQAKSLEFEQAASVDALTGTHNRRWLREAFPRGIARCERDGEPVCVLIADIDRFQSLNAQFGYLSGDAVLRRVARGLAEGLRAQDLLARHGGDEFLILLPHASIDEAMLIAERLRGQVLAGSGLETAQGVKTVTISCGVAQLTPGETLEALVSRAEAAVRRAKENGRDRVEIAAG
jgi:diguanylate cyclase (GGDEF)-like protein